MCHIDFPSLPAVQVPEALYTPFLWKTLVCWISMCMYLKLLEYIFIVSETFHQICDMTDPSNMNKDEWDDAGQIQLFACTLGSVKNISWVQDSGHIKKSTTSMDVKEFWHKTDGFKKEKHPTQKITNFQRCGTGPWAVGPSSTNGCHNEQVIFWVLKHVFPSAAEGFLLLLGYNACWAAMVVFWLATCTHHSPPVCQLLKTVIDNLLTGKHSLRITQTHCRISWNNDKRHAMKQTRQQQQQQKTGRKKESNEWKF